MAFTKDDMKTALFKELEHHGVDTGKIASFKVDVTLAEMLVATNKVFNPEANKAADKLPPAPAPERGGQSR